MVCGSSRLSIDVCGGRLASSEVLVLFLLVVFHAPMDTPMCSPGKEEEAGIAILRGKLTGREPAMDCLALKAVWLLKVNDRFSWW